MEVPSTKELLQLHVLKKEKKKKKKRRVDTTLAKIQKEHDYIPTA
jgi:Ser-tRNA(Ala) deacylase AlaX